MHTRAGRNRVQKTYQPKAMIQTPRPPCDVSLAELITLGFLSESDVSPDGHVDESRRCRAEQQFFQARPHTAPPERHRRPPRNSRPPYVRPPLPDSRPQTVRGSSAHVHRIHVRRDVQGTEKTPVHFVLDTCCICYSNLKDHAIVPCFHMCVCSACSRRIQHLSLIHI